MHCLNAGAIPVLLAFIMRYSSRLAAELAAHVADGTKSKSIAAGSRPRDSEDTPSGTAVMIIPEALRALFNITLLNQTCVVAARAAQAGETVRRLRDASDIHSQVHASCESFLNQMVDSSRKN